MYYNVHSLTAGVVFMEKYVNNAQVSGPDKTLKGWNSEC